MEEIKAIVKNVDMTDEMQQDAVEFCADAMEKYTLEKDIAGHIKREFDIKYNPTWHCVVGSKFGSFITHEQQGFIYFHMGKNTVLLFKSG